MACNEFVIRKGFISKADSFITGSLTVTEAIIAEELYVQSVTSSIIYSSGSNIFGDESSDVQQFTGSVRLNDSIYLPNSGTAGPNTTGKGLYIKNASGTDRLTLYRASGNALRLDNQGDNDTYMDIRGATDFNVYNADTDKELFTVSSSGDVGIGISNPKVSLHIKDTVPNIRLEDSDNNSLSQIFYNTDSLTIAVDDGDASSTGKLKIDIGETEIMRITSSGYVGINTTDPERTLHVVNQSGLVSTKLESTTGHLIDLYGGGSFIGHRFYQDGNHRISTSYITGSSGDYWQVGTNWATGGEILTVTQGGDVGIGTTTPEAKLSLYKNASQGNPSNHNPANATLKIQDSANQMYFDGNSIIQTGVASLTIGNTQDSSIIFYTSGSERVRFQYDGKVGIGDETPSALLDVKNLVFIDEDESYSGYGAVGFGGLSNGYARIFGNTSNYNLYVNAGLGGDIRFRTSGSSTNKVVIDPDGRVGIGTDNPGYELVVRDSSDNSWAQVITGGTNKNAGSIYTNDAGSWTVGIRGADSDKFYIGNQVGLSAGEFVIDTGGRVGIGTESPDTNYLTHMYSTNSAQILTLETNVDSGVGTNLVIKNTNDRDVGIQFYWGDGGATNGGIAYIWADGNGNDALKISAGSAYAGEENIEFHQNGNVVVNNSLTVGASDSTPSSTLDIRGDVTIANPSGISQLNINGDATGSSVINLGDENDGNVGRIYYDHSNNFLQIKTNDDEKLRITGAGDVGIGTPYPERLLHVSESTAQGVARFQNSSTTMAFIDFLDANTTAENKVRVGAKKDDLSLWAGGGERIYVSGSNGYVGIGTPTPRGRLHSWLGDSGQTVPNASANGLLVEDNADNGISILTPSTAIGSIFFGDESDNFVGGVRYDHSDNSMRLYTNNAEAVVVESGGNVGIASTNPSAKLDVAGVVKVSDYIRIDRNADERAIVFEDSGGDDTCFITVNDSQGNFNIMLGVDGAGQYVVTNDGAAKTLYSGHSQDGVVSLNAAPQGTAGNVVSYSIGLAVDSNDNTIRVGASNDDLGLDGLDGNKVFDVTGSLYTDKIYARSSAGLSLMDDAGNLGIFIEDSTGDVGIGTTNPSYNLDVRNGDEATDDFPAIFVKNGNSANANIAWFQHTSDYIYIRGDGGSGDYEIGNSQQRNSISFKDGTGGIYINYSESAGTPSIVSIFNGSGTQLRAPAGGSGDILTIETQTNREFYWDTTNPDHLKKGQNLIFNADPSNSHADTLIGFYVDNDEKVRIENTGRVGIGITQPLAYLHIDGNSYPQILLDGGSDTTGDIVIPTGEILQMGHWDNATTTYTDRFRIYNNGYVGIGTTTPGTKFEVNASTDNQVAAFISTDNRASISIQDNDTAGAIGVEDGYLFFSANGSPSLASAEMVIGLTNQKVGIGEVTPTAQLQVTGDISTNWAGRFENSNANGYGILATTPNAVNYSDVVFEARGGADTYNATGTALKIFGNGDSEFYGPINRFSNDCQDVIISGITSSYQYLDTREYMQQKGHFAESTWIPGLFSSTSHRVVPFMDNTNIYLDGQLQKANVSAFTINSISSANLSADTRITADKPIIVQESNAQAMPLNTSFTGKYLGSMANRYWPVDAYIYSPHGTATVEIYRSTNSVVDVSSVSSADHMYTVEVSASSGFQWQEDVHNGGRAVPSSGTHYYIVKSNIPVCAGWYPDGGDYMLMSPAGMEMLATDYADGEFTFFDYNVSGSIQQQQNGTAIYWKELSGKNGMFANNTADGAGGDAEFAMPLEYLSDYYIHTDPNISNYRIAAYQPTKIVVLDTDGNVFDTIDLHNASKEKPLYYSTGSESGATSIGANGPYRFIGSSTFYMIAQEPGADAECVLLGALQSRIASHQSFKGGSIPGNIEVTGSISATGDVTANDFITTSDRRLKSEIQEIESGLEILKLFKSYTYTKNENEDAGFIAQEVQEALPYAVKEGDGGFLTMKDRPVLAHIHKAVMELEQKLQNIEDKIK